MYLYCLMYIAQCSMACIIPVFRKDIWRLVHECNTCMVSPQCYVEMFLEATEANLSTVSNANIQHMCVNPKSV